MGKPCLPQNNKGENNAPLRRTIKSFQINRTGRNRPGKGLFIFMIKPRTLSGFMELLPAPQQQMERIMETLRRTYSLYGFTPLDTPLIEDAQILLAKGGGETEK